MTASSSPAVDRRSPAAGARLVLRELNRLGNEWVEAHGDPAKDFVQRELVPQMRANSSVTGEGLAREIARLANGSDAPDDHGMTIGWYLKASCAYAIDAIRAQDDGRLVDAWCYAADAKFWLGVLAGTWRVQRDDPENAKLIAKSAISASHSARAQKPRLDKKRKKPTHKWVTVAAMKRARHASQEFKEFLEAAANDAVSGLSIQKLQLKGVDKWRVTIDELSTTVDKSKSTLWTWWGQADTA